MSFGKLYGFRGNARTMVLLAVAKENNLDIELVETNPDFPLTDEYLKLNPRRTIPTFQAPDGWVLIEAIAIAVYFTSQDKQTTLLGKTPREYAEILRWMSFINSEVQPSLANWFKPVVGRRAYDKNNVKIAQDAVNNALAMLEAHLLSTGNTYIIGETITLADCFAASSLSRGFMYVFGRDWQKVHPCITRWFVHFVQQPIWKNVVPNPVVVEKAVQHPSQVKAKL